MDVLSSISKIDIKIMDFANSSTIYDLEINRNQLFEYTVVAIIAEYIDPYKFDDRIKRLLSVADYESLTLLTHQEIKDFCIDYFILIEEWIEKIKSMERKAPNLYRISKNYSLYELISLYNI